MTETYRLCLQYMPLPLEKTISLQIYQIQFTAFLSAIGVRALPRLNPLPEDLP